MPTLEATNLNVRFGEHPAVRDIDLSVDTGQRRRSGCLR